MAYCQLLFSFVFVAISRVLGATMAAVVCRVLLSCACADPPLCSSCPRAPVFAATYHVGGFLISIGEIGCVVIILRWRRRLAVVSALVVDGAASIEIRCRGATAGACRS